MNHSPFPYPDAKAGRSMVWLLWFLVLGAVAVVAHRETAAWDIDVYHHAMKSVAAGRDPYADGIAAQIAAHRPNMPSILGPFTYVYSPITLPVIKLFAGMPQLVSLALYALLYAAGVAAQSRFGLGLMEESEWRVLRYFVPIAIFFPGLLGSDNILSGNVAYIFYGAALLCTVRALRTGTWRWFYCVVLIASCFKAPLLTLLAIPVLCARRQWLPAMAAGTGGLVLFAAQRILWPEHFRNYLEAVRLQFSFNRDFGSSPAGLFSGWLFDHHLAYSPACSLFYAAYSVPLFAALVYLSRRYLRGEFSTREWLPVLLIGVVLLNPRLMEYDVAPLALPMAIVLWRFFATGRSAGNTLLCVLAIFVPLNLLATHTWGLWKLTEGPTLVACLLCGMATLQRSAQTAGEITAIPAVLTEA